MTLTLTLTTLTGASRRPSRTLTRSSDLSVKRPSRYPHDPHGTPHVCPHSFTKRATWGGGPERQVCHDNSNFPDRSGPPLQLVRGRGSVRLAGGQAVHERLALR